MKLSNKPEALALLRRDQELTNALATIGGTTEKGDSLQLQTLGLSFSVRVESLELLLKSEQIEINRNLEEL